MDVVINYYLALALAVSQTLVRLIARARHAACRHAGARGGLMRFLAGTLFALVHAVPPEQQS